MYDYRNGPKYIAPGQGQTAPWGQSLDVSRNIMSFHLFAARLKNIYIYIIIFFYDLV